MKFIIFLSLLSFSTFAVNENKLVLSLHDTILPFYDNGESHSYMGVDNFKVHYKKISQSDKCTLIFLPGRTEPTRKYAELAYDLKDLGCDFFLWDPRGQGHSQRLLDDPMKGHVEDYRDYLTDFKKFWDLEIKERKNVGIVAHSMGAAIALGSLIKYQLPIKAISLSSPMMQIKTKDLPESASLWTMKVMKLVGKKNHYVPGGSAHSEEEAFEDSRVTSSKARYELSKVAYENVGLGSPTNNWLLEAIRLTRLIKKRKSRKKLQQYPMLLFQATIDTFSKDRRQRKFCNKLPKCQFFRLEGAKHEMYQERDEFRTPVIQKIKKLMKGSFSQI